jgi:hypothetical protein
MVSKFSGETEPNRETDRRRFLRTIGATGVAGFLVGCLGDGDDGEPTDTTDDTDDTDTNTDDTEEPTETTDEDTTEVIFQVTEFEPVDAEIQVGESLTAAALIVNTAEGEGSQTVEYRIGDEVYADEDVTLEGFGEKGITFEVDLEGLEEGEHTHGIYTDDDEMTGTLVVESIPELQEPLITPANEDLPLTTGAEEYTVEGSVENPFLEDIVEYTVALSVPDDWEVLGDSEQSLEEISTFDSETLTFEIDIPEGAEGGEHELVWTEDYDAGSAGYGESVESTWSIEVFSQNAFDATWVELAAEASVQPETGITTTDVWGEIEGDVAEATSENSVSFAAWVRFDETHTQESNPTGTIWYGYNPADGGDNSRWEFNYDENGFGEVNVSNHGNPSQHWESDTHPTEGQWYHIAWVYPEAALVNDEDDDVEVGVYINGSRDGEVEEINGSSEWQNYPIRGGDLPMQLGADPELQEGRGFVGAIAHPTLWDGALTGAEIGALAGDPGAIDDVEAEELVRWDFADASEDSVDDQSGQGNHGDLVGDYSLESGEISHFYQS